MNQLKFSTTCFQRGVLACALLILGGCATDQSLQQWAQSQPTPSTQAVQVEGRLALRIDSVPIQAHQASFMGWLDEQSGSIDWFAPTGQAVAQVWWSPNQAAISRNARQPQLYPSFAQLSRDLTGTELPQQVLSDWMRGLPTPAEGWNVQRVSSEPLRILAERLQPEPAVRLTLLLENSP